MNRFSCCDGHMEEDAGGRWVSQRDADAVIERLTRERDEETRRKGEAWAFILEVARSLGVHPSIEPQVVRGEIRAAIASRDFEMRSLSERNDKSVAYAEQLAAVATTVAGYLEGNMDNEREPEWLRLAAASLRAALAKNPNNALHVAGVGGLPARADTVPSSAVGSANERECGSNPPEALPAQSSSPDDVVGHKTFRDGAGFCHEPLTRAEADEIWKRVEAAKAKREADMPTEEAAIRYAFDGWVRLKDFGWSEAIYCPKDGTPFLAIEPGSTGIHACSYMGEWPSGSWWIHEDGDMSPSRPMLWKPKGGNAP